MLYKSDEVVHTNNYPVWYSWPIKKRRRVVKAYGKGNALNSGNSLVSMRGPEKRYTDTEWS
jgi:hypothetical protein